MTDLNENAATPADVAVLVERLSRLSGNSVLAKSCREAATTLLSLSARIEALEAENEHYKEIGSLAVKFRLDDDVFVETRGAGVWAVANGSAVLNTDGEWEYEPRPSSREDDFIDRTRFSFSDAMIRARAALSRRATGGE